MMILRTYKCNSLDCFDSNNVPHYSRHGAVMKMMILRTYKCNSLHCFDSNNMFNILQLPCGDDEYDDIADL